MPAGDNEKACRERMAGRIKEKLSFKNDEDVYISVDGHFEYEDKLYLVEIDSGNQAKLLAGQYILLNVLWKDIKIEEKSYAMDNCIFLVVHYYDNYNTDRTTNVLSELKNDLELSLSFMILHENKLTAWEDLIKQISKNTEGIQ